MKNEILNNSIEAKTASLSDKLKRLCPNLYWDRFVMVDPSQTRLGIDDISFRAEGNIQDSIEILLLSCRGWIDVYDAEKLTLQLANRLQRLLSTLNRNRTVVLLPGEGAKIVRGLLPTEMLEGYPQVEIPTQRTINNGSVQGVLISDKTLAKQALLETRIKAVVVIDDVIVTGTTLQTLKETFPNRNVVWYGASLMMRSPLQRSGFPPKSDSGINGYDSIITPIVYQGTSGTPAINSFSTLIENSPKSESVRNAYIQKYVEDKCVFLDAVRNLRERMLR